MSCWCSLEHILIIKSIVIIGTFSVATCNICCILPLIRVSKSIIHVIATSQWIFLSFVIPMLDWWGMLVSLLLERGALVETISILGCVSVFVLVRSIQGVIGANWLCIATLVEVVFGVGVVAALSIGPASIRISPTIYVCIGWLNI